jgi:hypothetical protein
VKLRNFPFGRGDNGFWKREAHPAGDFRIERFQAASVDGAIYSAGPGAALGAGIETAGTRRGDSFSIPLAELRRGGRT